MKFYEELSHTTVFIKGYKNAFSQSTGTGFFFMYQAIWSSGNHPGESRQVQEIVMVTNKHVIKGMKTVQLTFSVCDEQQNPIYGTIYRKTILINDPNWIMHPDPAIDICILLVRDIFDEALRQNVHIYTKCFSASDLPGINELNQLDALENILIAGYPSGIYDSVNNRPVFKTGITATDVKLNCNGKPDFLVDASITPGSSGSPVFIANAGGYMQDGNMFFGANRVLLLGIIYATYNINAAGRFTLLPFASTRTAIPSHIGIAVRAEKLYDFNNLIPHRDPFLE